MENLIQYKGYCGSINFSDEDRVFHGKIEFVRALVTYEAADVAGLKVAYKEAVDDYLAMCRVQGIDQEAQKYFV